MSFQHPHYPIHYVPSPMEPLFHRLSPGTCFNHQSLVHTLTFPGYLPTKQNPQHTSMPNTPSPSHTCVRHCVCYPSTLRLCPTPPPSHLCPTSHPLFTLPGPIRNPNLAIPHTTSNTCDQSHSICFVVIFPCPYPPSPGPQCQNETFIIIIV
jgi:hypothetical protein